MLGRLLRFLFLLILSGFGWAQADESAREIPAAFQGEWNSDVASCGTSRNATRLRIGADWIAFHESEGKVEVFASQGARELALIALLQGEGERWQSFRHFRLSEDGQRLSDITYGSNFVRQRCPD